MPEAGGAHVARLGCHTASPRPRPQVTARLTSSLPVLGYRPPLIGPNGAFSYDARPVLLAAGISAVAAGDMAPASIAYWLRGLAALLPGPLDPSDAGGLLNCLEAAFNGRMGAAQSAAGDADAAAAAPTGGGSGKRGGMRARTRPARWPAWCVLDVLEALQELRPDTYRAQRAGGMRGHSCQHHTLTVRWRAPARGTCGQPCHLPAHLQAP